jgi:hypothetical protein
MLLASVLLELVARVEVSAADAAVEFVRVCHASLPWVMLPAT